VDLSLLLDRDHDQLDRAIATLIEPADSDDARQATLDAVRASFAAHADAEATVLHAALSQVAVKHDLVSLVAQTLAEHRIQESILRRLDVRARPDDWICSVIRLRRTLAAHGSHEAATIVPNLRDTLAPIDYERLAQRYATERLRALDMLSLMRVSQGGGPRTPRRAAR